MEFLFSKRKVLSENLDKLLEVDNRLKLDDVVSLIVHADD